MNQRKYSEYLWKKWNFSNIVTYLDFVFSIAACFKFFDIIPLKITSTYFKNASLTGLFHGMDPAFFPELTPSPRPTPGPLHCGLCLAWWSLFSSLNIPHFPSLWAFPSGSPSLPGLGGSSLLLGFMKQNKLYKVPRCHCRNNQIII